MDSVARAKRHILLLLALSLGWFYITINIEDPSRITYKNRNDGERAFFPAKSKYKQTRDGKSTTVCQNVLHNLTVGKWVPLTNPEKNSSYYDDIYRGYWLERDMTEKLWRDDGKCGNRNQLPKISGSKWPRLSSWCNPQSDTPCCNNAAGGICAAPNSSTCECPNCVDMRKYHHAEMSEWKTEDERCAWRYYSTGTEACDVIERSPYNSIHFVGDSLIRNMFYALLTILTDDKIGGTWAKNTNEELKTYCRAEKKFFFKCKGIIRSMNDVLHPDKLCGGRKPNFTVNALISYGSNLEQPIKKLVKELNGRDGSIMFLHLGLHLGMKSKLIIEKYLSPILKSRQTFYESHSNNTNTMWPKFYFVPPLLSGLMKPGIFLPTQGKDAAAKFSKQIREFCLKHNITFFDVRPFSRFVHSFDGTHYGLGVNLMKNQLMLNHFDELTH